METELWWTGQIQCDACNFRWQGVIPVTTDHPEPPYSIECPNCGGMYGDTMESE